MLRVQLMTFSECTVSALISYSVKEVLMVWNIRSL